jgi:hypothetical protein
MIESLPEFAVADFKNMVIIGAAVLLWVLMLTTSAFREIAAASETIQDEAGRTIYTIDDDGTVSMFENSTMDLTLSVTRGTRDQMRPQITDISPNAIPAGVSIVLKLKGKNLIGANTKLSVPGIELGAYSAKPNSLDIPVTVSASIPPGEVILYLTTPVGTTQTSFKVLELQINASVKRDVERPKISAAAPSSCPGDMIGMSAEFGGFCIDLDKSFTATFGQSEKLCSTVGKRLCQAAEWKHACEQAKQGTVPVKNMTGAWEWTGSWDQSYARDLTSDIQNLVIGKEDCQKRLSSPQWKSEKFEGRCCK